MRKDEDGIWLTPAEWIRWMHHHHPGAFIDPDAKIPPPPSQREESKQWQAGRGRGLLARTSPLAAERRAKECS